MGRGTSKAGRGIRSSARRAGTPSGVTYDQFMQMSEEQKFSTIRDIIDDRSIVVPDYLDSSETTKVMYALGMAEKPTVVSDDQLDTMDGLVIYRTVYEGDGMPPPSSDAILDQIRHGDYTQMSGSGGSAHGRAIYFATDFEDSRIYGDGEKNALIMRAKIKPGSKFVHESTLKREMLDKHITTGTFSYCSPQDVRSLYALSQGIAGWFSGTYTMIVNRGSLIASSQNKKTSGKYSAFASTWKFAYNAD